MPGPFGSNERRWYRGPDGVVLRETDFDGDRRADCRIVSFDTAASIGTTWLKVNGRWEVASADDCIDLMPEALKGKTGRP